MMGLKPSLGFHRPRQGQATASNTEKPPSFSWAAAFRDVGPHTWTPLGSSLRGGCPGVGNTYGKPLSSRSLGRLEISKARPAWKDSFWASSRMGGLSFQRSMVLGLSQSPLLS